MKDSSTSKIEQLIDEIEEFIESCKPQPFSQSKVIVPKDELYELLTELRLKTPEEITRYQKIISNREKIINDAQAQAERMVEETNVYVNQLVEENQIMAQAYDRAQELLDAAQAQAAETVNAANEDAEGIRRSALQYTQELINNLQQVIGGTLDVAKSNYEGLISGLSYNLDVLTSNREALEQQLATPVEIPAYEPVQTRAEDLLPPLETKLSGPARTADDQPAREEAEDEDAGYENEDDVDLDDDDLEDDDYDDID